VTEDVGLSSPPTRRSLIDGLLERRAATRRDHPARDTWLLPGIAATMGLGLVLVALADVLGGNGSRWGEPAFWAGMGLLWIPPVVRLLGTEARRRERIALLLLLGMGMYVVKVLYSPLSFYGYDEFQHWRTAQDIVRSGKLFEPNPLLPVSPLYPGLEIATSAIVKLTGLSVFVSGTLVVGAARLTMIVALYLLFETALASSWLAGVATAVYFLNPQFLFFDSAYAYESLGLVLALLALYIVVRRSEGHWPYAPGTTFLVILLLAATVVTHHVSSFVLAFALLLFAAISLAFPSAQSRLWQCGIALIAVSFVLMWLYLVASSVIGYLGPKFIGGVSEVLHLIVGEGSSSGSRSLFQSYVGPSTPTFDRAASFAFTATMLVALPLGWLQIWRTRRIGATVVFLVICSLAYPASGLFRFTTIGAELNERLVAFVFVPVAYCAAMAISGRPQIRSSLAWRTALTAISAVLLYGGIVIGTPYWARLPGPYLASADHRSIEAQGISAALWAKQFLGPANRIGADRINQILMLTFGEQWPVTAVSDKVDPASVFFGPVLTPFDRGLLRSGGVHYLVVDYRFTRDLPWLGYYYVDWEPDAFKRKRPLPSSALAKFDRTPGVSRVFDSGDIAIFDVERFALGG
jgi:hypothetical protein